jgi:hypothetical protein
MAHEHKNQALKVAVWPFIGPLGKKIYLQKLHPSLVFLLPCQKISSCCRHGSQVRLFLPIILPFNINGK